MAILHIVNKSPFGSNALTSCLRLIKRDSGILLIEDGVYAAQRHQPDSNLLAEAMTENALYALEPDLRARGLDHSRIMDEITLVDYAGFVDLVSEYDNTMSWF